MPDFSMPRLVDDFLWQKSKISHAICQWTYKDYNASTHSANFFKGLAFGMTSSLGAAKILEPEGVDFFVADGDDCPGAKLPPMLSLSIPCLEDLGFSASTLQV